MFFSKAIKHYLFTPVTVALAFIIGGFVILLIERRKRAVRVHDVDSVTAADAVWVGIAQAFALIPGTSRSGATIMSASGPSTSISNNA